VPDDPERGASEAARAFVAREREVRAARAAEDAVARDTAERMERERAAEYDNRPVAWIGIAVALLLVIAGWFLINRLIDQNRLEDCVMAHRHDCAGVPEPR